jgi:hypothetical protein
MLPMDKVATNPAVRFNVETFVPADGFVPNRAYLTRLLWKDLDGNDQSKLLLSEPETVLAVAVSGQSAPTADNAAAAGNGAKRPSRKRQPAASETPEQ